MEPDTAACPYCAKVIEPRPRRNRRCPHCQRHVLLRQGALFTEDDARAFDERKKTEAADAESRKRAAHKEDLRALLAEVLAEARAGKEGSRLAAFKVFRSPLTTWESLFARAAEFVSDLGPGRVISVSHSEDQDDAVVTVWYWTEPVWGGVGEEGRQPGRGGP
jgi:hypothetical protein